MSAVFDCNEYIKFYYGTDSVPFSHCGFIQENKIVIDFVQNNVLPVLRRSCGLAKMRHWQDIGSSGVFYPYYLFAPYTQNAIFSDIDPTALHVLHDIDRHLDTWTPYRQYIWSYEAFEDVYRTPRFYKIHNIETTALEETDLITSFFCIDTLPDFKSAFANCSKAARKFMFVAGIDVDEDYYLVEDQKVYGSAVSFDAMKTAFSDAFEIVAAEKYPALQKGDKDGGYKEFYCVFGRKK